MLNNEDLSIRSVYNDILASETGKLSEENIDLIYKALVNREKSLCIIALWSAARALVFPQIPVKSVEQCVLAIRTIFEITERSHDANARKSVETIINSGSVDNLDSQQEKALLCFTNALRFLITRDFTDFLCTIEVLASSQIKMLDAPRKARLYWIGWLDDVVCRNGRFSIITMLELVERTLLGTIGHVPTFALWEAAGDDKGRFDVWAMDAKTRRLIQPVMMIDPIVLKDETLFVRVLDQPSVVKDPLRIEYLFEHWIHRLFLAEAYLGRYKNIEYYCQSTAETWRAPA
jgi:hypothetical protein